MHALNRGYLSFAATFPSFIFSFEDGISDATQQYQLQNFGCPLPQMPPPHLPFICSSLSYMSARTIGILAAVPFLFYKLLGLSMLLVFVGQFLQIWNIPFTLALKFMFLSCGRTIQDYGLCCLVVQTYLSDHHAWYLIFAYLAKTIGIFMGFSFAYINNYSFYAPFPSLCLSLSLAIFFLLKMNFQTLALSLEKDDTFKARRSLSHLYSPIIVLKVMDHLQLQIDQGVFQRALLWALSSKMEAIPLPRGYTILMLVFFFLVQCNGHILLRIYGFGFVSGNTFSLTTQMGSFIFGVNVVRLLSAICALVVVSQVCHKLILICGSIILTHCWLVVYALMGHVSHSCTQVIVVTIIIVTVYQFFEVWCLKSIRLVLSFEMETMFGNIWLIALTYLFQNLRNLYLFYDPIFLSRTEVLLYCGLNAAVSILVSQGSLFFITCYRESRNRRKQKVNKLLFGRSSFEYPPVLAKQKPPSSLLLNQYSLNLHLSASSLRTISMIKSNIVLIYNKREVGLVSLFTVSASLFTFNFFSYLISLLLSLFFYSSYYYSQLAREIICFPQIFSHQTTQFFHIVGLILTRERLRTTSNGYMAESSLLSAARSECTFKVNYNSKPLFTVMMMGGGVDTQEGFSHHCDQYIDKHHQDSQTQDNDDDVVGRGL